MNELGGQCGADERIVMSGATGFLGRYLARDLLRRLPGARLALLVRDTVEQPAAPRIRKILDSLRGAEWEPDLEDRIEVLPADITRARCGLAEHAYGRIAAQATRIVHAAADVRFDHSLGEARQVNVEGTRNVLALAVEAGRAGRLRSLAYVGTAFVAGRRRGVAREDELRAERGFHNSYERTKFEAEELVRSRVGHLPIVILRPSVIVGESHSGATPNFKAIYWPLKVYARGLWRIVPGNPRAVIDMVPVDFAAAAAAHLALDERAVGRCFHLCAGAERSVSLGDLAAKTSSFFGLPPPRFVNPFLFLAVLRPLFYAIVSKQRREVLRKGVYYRPYLNMSLTFDTSNARALLDAEGIRPPHVDAYWESLLRYCVESDWGRCPRPARTATC